MARADARRPPIALVGTGHAARALVAPLHAAGYPLAALVGRRRGALASLGRGLPVGRRSTRPSAARAGRLVLLAVSDGALETLAATLAEAGDWRGRTVLHLAGALGPEVLAPLAAAGAACGVLHPLQCLGDARLAARLLDGSAARIEGDTRARRDARRLAHDLGLRPLVAPALDTHGRAGYHAAASLVANDLVALVYEAESLLVEAGFRRAAARAGLLSLARGTLAQFEARGPRGALTGPVARADLATLERQLARLAKRSPDLAEAHRALSRRLAELAATEGLTGAARVARALARPGGAGYSRSRSRPRRSRS